MQRQGFGRVVLQIAFDMRPDVIQCGAQINGFNMGAATYVVWIRSNLRDTFEDERDFKLGADAFGLSAKGRAPIDIVLARFDAAMMEARQSGFKLKNSPAGSPRVVGVGTEDLAVLPGPFGGRGSRPSNSSIA